MKRTNTSLITAMAFALAGTAAPVMAETRSATEPGEISAYPATTTAQLKPVMRSERKNMTQLWLNMQTRGQMATSQTDTLTPEAAKATQQRMQQSFSHPIPDKFIKDNFGGS
ncbi:DUF3613 domain-containing protein [Photobacterium sp. WH77]|uniref:DUF3613 domain-containing protein n=1 Tax=unclassified Photobacterium TaxID=2628852 RepID=UPI001EDC7B1E|nr:MULTISPECIES: DUF3613 domain-containing protein [unclassified Photobacterium]MCG2837856.1 DUF3613 domain-containing protein [Photobacterium sp. WH77]MCG2845474.1 DUF3613 domain-containing protein [Photobacterium sp. WH80]